MPVNLLDILLALVHEEQLWWYIATALWCIVHRACLVIILLDSEIPERDLVVRTGGSKDGVFGRVPFDGSDGSSVPREGGDGRWVRGRGPIAMSARPLGVEVRKDSSPLLLDVSQIPHLDATLIATTEQQVGRTPVPTDDVHVARMRHIHPRRTLPPLTPHIPNSDALISRTRSEYGRL